MLTIERALEEAIDAVEGRGATVPPNLDQTALDAAAILDVLATGRITVPAFAGQLEERQLADVRADVACGRTARLRSVP